jgi:AcrR family transcriptional regulator
VTASRRARAATRLDAVAHSAAETRVIDAAVDLFAEHGIGGTSLQMIADALGVTKAAVYHQYNTKDEIILAVAEIVLARLEAAVVAAEAERSSKRARAVLIAGMIDVAVERRRIAGVLQRDPVMLRFLDRHEPFRRVMTRLNRVLMGGASDARARVQVATITGIVGGAVIHPLVIALDDETQRSHQLKQVKTLLDPR